MNFAKKIFTPVILLLLITAGGYAQTNRLFQYSTIIALSGGAFDGNMTIGQMKSEGNFGLGTFNGVNGEMVYLNGKAYRVQYDGKVVEVNNNELIPFCVTTNFSADTSFTINGNFDFEKLKQLIDKSLPSKNLIYAVKVNGVFDYIKTRSVNKQKKPYPQLAEVTKDQHVFEFNNVAGTLIGFRFPMFFKDVNVPGYHFHFLSDDANKGGHLLKVRFSSAEVEIQYVQNFNLKLSESPEALNLNVEQKIKSPVE